MKPSIGRIVHLCWHGRRVPAIVFFIDEDGLPALRALDDSGVVIYHAVHADETPESAQMQNLMTTQHMTWSWPPKV